MYPAARRRSADPLAGAIGERRAPIQAHGPLEHSPGAPIADAIHKGLVLDCSLSSADTLDHSKTRLLQLADAATRHTWIWICQGYHHLCDAGSDDCFGTRRGAAVVAAGLEGDVERA